MKSFQFWLVHTIEVLLYCTFNKQFQFDKEAGIHLWHLKCCKTIKGGYNLSFILLVHFHPPPPHQKLVERLWCTLFTPCNINSLITGDLPSNKWPFIFKWGLISLDDANGEVVTHSVWSSDGETGVLLSYRLIAVWETKESRWLLK